MKKIMITLLAFSFLTTTHASTTQAENNLIEAGNAVIEENEQILAVALTLKEQIKEKKQDIIYNMGGIYLGTFIALKAIVGVNHRRTMGSALTSFYIALGFSGVSYNTYQIVVKNQDIDKLETLLDEKISKLEGTISDTEVLLNTLN